jgi:sulfate transport system permease protein
MRFHYCSRTNAEDAAVTEYDPLQEPAWLRWGLILAAIALIVFLILMPLLMVLAAAFGEGFGAWLGALRQPDAIAALKLTLFTTAIVLPVNAVFGLLTAWAVTRFEFKGKRILLALIDLPFAVSPVVAGLCLELIPLMQQQGAEEELAARSLGASAWTMFWRVTLPNIKWGLLYGVLLCSARAMGEFGAVSVVSGHIRGLTNTLPLHIEILYNEFDSTGAFAAASLLSGLALVTLVLKYWLESRHGEDLAKTHRRA